MINLAEIATANATARNNELMTDPIALSLGTPANNVATYDDALMLGVRILERAIDLAWGADREAYDNLKAGLADLIARVEKLGFSNVIADHDFLPICVAPYNEEDLINRSAAAVGAI